MHAGALAKRVVDSRGSFAAGGGDLPCIRIPERGWKECKQCGCGEEAKKRGHEKPDGKTGLTVSSIHIKHIFPMPADLGAIMRRFRKVLVPEENSGQFRMLLRSTYMLEPLGLNKVQGQPLNSDEILCKIEEILRGN